MRRLQFSFVKMFSHLAVALSVLHVTTSSHMKFPPHFKFGAATSSYQIEGGWNEDGKGPSIWDKLCHSNPNYINNNETGDVAADSYHKWREDVNIAEEMGLHFYRFSISWPRILPTGFNNEINRAGVKYYSDLIDALLAKGIEPVITMYHWELPVAIQDLGGWTNPLIVDWFADYARILYSEYAGRVKTWITINEPMSICDFNYNLGTFAPRIRETEFAPFLCNKYVLLAHATAYRMYHQEYKHKHGKLAMANNVIYMDPASADDLELAELARQHSTGRYSYPIFSETGGWPPAIERLMLEYSLKQGYNVSRLPTLTNDEKEFIKGTGDFFGLNYYTLRVIKPAKHGEDTGVWFVTGSPELNAVLEMPPDPSYGALAMLPIYPKGLRHVLNWLKKEYNNIDIMIVENGLSTKDYELNDLNRIDFIRDHLKEVLLAINNDGVNVIAYTVWSLIDNFEWTSGYSAKFGLYEVDFTSPERTRTPKASARFYNCVIKKHALNECAHHKRHIHPARQRNGSSIFKNNLLSIVFVFLAIFNH